MKILFYWFFCWMCKATVWMHTAILLNKIGGHVLLLRLNMMWYDFEKLIYIIWTSHLYYLCALLINLNATFRSSCLANMHISSSKLEICVLSDCREVKIRNTVGDSTPPYGTPELILCIEDICYNWYQLGIKLDWSIWNIEPDKITFSLYNSLLNHTLPKA